MPAEVKWAREQDFCGPGEASQVVALRLLYRRSINYRGSKPMKLLLSTMFRKLPVRTTKQRATICKRCGVRIYSLSYLKAHLESHDRKTH
jgi:hypothetical protein